MSSINSVGVSPHTVQAVATPAVDAAGTAAAATVTPAASTTPPPTGAPILLPPAGHCDHAGASAMMSAYTALIVLVCEANRENYAANRTMVEAEVQTRVNELMSAADKRRTGAIISLVLGVVGGAVGIAGGAAGVAQSGKSLNQLHDLGKLQNRVHTFINDPRTETVLAELKSAPGTKDRIAGQVQQGISLDLRTVEAKTARTQSLGIMFTALKETFASAGQGAQGLLGAEADTITARAEQTQGDIQITMSNMQQYQDLMGKFTQILSDLLEAENKARSAAAQA